MTYSEGECLQAIRTVVREAVAAELAAVCAILAGHMAQVPVPSEAEIAPGERATARWKS